MSLACACAYTMCLCVSQCTGVAIVNTLPDGNSATTPLYRGRVLLNLRVISNEAVTPTASVQQWAPIVLMTVAA